MPGCSESGTHRAPKGRSELTDFFWFCLEHVREYNRHWDFCAGMSAGEIEEMIRCDTTWQRPTWPMGDWHSRERDLRSRVRREFADACFESADTRKGYGNGQEHAHRDPRNGSQVGSRSSPRQRAMAVLQLEEPVTFAEIKARYRDLVKRHHPDVNGGSRSSEERLKAINEAYTTLKAGQDG